MRKPETMTWKVIATVALLLLVVVVFLFFLNIQKTVAWIVFGIFALTDFILFIALILVIIWED